MSVTEVVDSRGSNDGTIRRRRRCKRCGKRFTTTEIRVETLKDNSKKEKEATARYERLQSAVRVIYEELGE